MIGWIKLHRKFQSWSWYHKSEMVHLFIHLLLKANHEPNKFENRIIDTGQVVTGRKKLNEDTGISEQTIRTCLERLRDTKEITIKSTNKYSIITIINYKTYQINDIKDNQQANQQLTNNQPTTNHNIRSKEVKNDKNKVLHLDLVLLTPNEYQKLLDKFGKTTAEDYIERLNNYGHNKPKEFKKYNSHYHTILTWYKKDEKDKPKTRTFKGDF